MGTLEEEVEEGYKPAAGFQEDSREPLLDLSLSDSSELWLLQWPLNELPDFHGLEISLDLNRDGCLGSFQDASGKLYDVVSHSAQEPSATVFASSALETKIVGKISRRATLVHFPEARVLEEQEAEKKSRRRQMGMRSSVMNSSSRSATPSRSMMRNSHSSRGHPASTHSSRHKSSLSELGDGSISQKRRRVQHAPSTDPSTLDSGRGHAISGLSEHSQQE